MKKLIYIILFFIGHVSLGQTYNGTGASNLQRAPTSKGFIYRNNMGALGNVNWWTKEQVDSLVNAAAGTGVLSFNGRTGVVVPLTGDYSGFYPLLNGTGATGTWGINITGNSGTVTNGVYTNTFNGLGDARYPQLSGSYTNPSWITSLAYSKLTGMPDLSVYELLSNKSTSTSLGTSNTLYPSQNAVKAYVDNAITGNTYTAGYGLGLTAFQFRSDSTVNVNFTRFNSVIPTATLARINTKLNVADTAAMLFPYQHKVTGGFIQNNLTNTPQNARISLSDSIKTTGVVQSSMINTDSTKYNMPWMGGGVILPGISEIKQSITAPGRLGFYASATGTTLAEKASLRNGGGMLAISGKYNDGPAFMVADSDYISHTFSTYYFAGSKGKGFLGFLHQNSTYTLTITPINGIRTALQYDSIGNVGIMQRTGVFTAFGKAAYNEAQPLTALSFLYKGKTDSLYAPITGSVNYIQNNLTNTPQSARISVSDSIKTSGVVKSGAILSVTTNTNSIDVSSNSFVWDNPSILTQFANSQTSYSGVYNSFVTYGYNQFGAGNATLKVVPSQYVLQSFARDTAFTNRYQASLVSGTNIKTINSNSLIGSGNVAVGDALVANALSQFASTTSAQLAGVISDETGGGSLVFGTLPILITPIITGTPSTPSAGIAIGSSALNRFSFTGQNGFLVSFNANGLTAARGFVMPDVAGTIATINGGQTFTSATWSATKIAEIYGGTNQSTYTTGDLLYASGANTLSKLGIGSTGNVLTVIGGIPAWSSTLSNGTTATTGTAGTGGTNVATQAYADAAITTARINALYGYTPANPASVASYSEGTWTPSGTDVTAVYGSYIKIGNQVTCYFYLTIDTNSDPLALQLGGLPFSNSNTTYGSVTINSITPAYTGITGLVVLSDTYCLLKNGATNITRAALSGAAIIGSITYRTN